MLVSVLSGSDLSMVTSLGISNYASEVVVGLIALLSLREALSGLKLWNKNISTSFNVAIVPLVLSFIGIILFMIVKN